MLNTRTLVGLPVIVDDRRIGRVILAELSADLTQLEGIWIAAGFFGARFIPADSLGTLGSVSVTADDSGRRRKSRPAPLLLRAVSTDGRRIGAVIGAEVDELSLRVQTLELTCGLWDDLLHGRRYISSFSMNQENGCVLIGAAETEKEEEAYEERYDEGSGHRRTDRRLCSDGLRRDELAVRKEHESTDEENRPLAGQQD